MDSSAPQSNPTQQRMDLMRRLIGSSASKDVCERRVHKLPSNITDRRTTYRTIRGERNVSDLNVLDDYIHAHEAAKMIDKDRYRGGSGYRSGKMRGARH